MTVTESQMSTDTSVKVAVRIRPQNTKEKYNMNHICTSVTPNEPQILIGKEKSFTFDYVFNINTKQDEIFNSLTKNLIDGCLEGYNATILAYGQTGSGKTYTMGSGFDIAHEPDEIGIIPRAVEYLFQRIENLRQINKEKNLPMPEFKVIAQFLELYNEELIDLLDTPDKTQKSHIKIHEDTLGSIYLTGVSTRLVSSLEDTLTCLKDGTLCRSTASTNMNSQSSRSHAIFTLHIKQQRLVASNSNNASQTMDSSNQSDLNNPLTLSTTGNNESTDFETLTAKFHFVDLAGSERLKRTGATGDRAKEGISINCGLLALGNVISTLGDNKKRGQHVPYRNSKLTRLLQDSLGGNSQTIMVACVSPSDCDFLETLNTLHYANRARNIQNKVSVNQDKASKQLNVMRQQIEGLQAELLEYKQGKRLADTEDGINDLFSENGMLQTENQSLRSRIKALAATIDTLKSRNVQILAEKESFMWKLKKQEYSSADEIGLIDLESEEIMKVVEKYTTEAEELRAKLAETEALVAVLQRNTASSAVLSSTSYDLSSSRLVGAMANQHISMTSDNNKSKNKSKKTLSTAKQVEINTVTEDIDKDSLNGDDVVEATSSYVEGYKEAEYDGNRDNDGDADGEDDIDEDDEDDDVDEEDDDESDKEDNDAEKYIHESLASLSSEIDVKKRLIEELQHKQKQLQKIRCHYEHQLEVLQHKIRETETERDQVLANLGEAEVSSEERVKKVKMEYEKKLSALSNQLGQLQIAKREHSLMLKNQEKKDLVLRQLQRELGELKSMKVQMSKKLREEAKRTREIETTRNREIIQLKKDRRLKDNQIRNLEQDKLKRDSVLKRKQEELESLRKRQNAHQYNLSQSIANITSSRYNRSAAVSRSIPSTPTPSLANSISLPSNTAGSTRSKYNTLKPIHSRQPPSLQIMHKRRRSTLIKLAKSKMDHLESLLTKAVNRRHTLEGYEQDMKTRVREREKLSRKLAKLDQQRRALINKAQPTDQVEYEMKNIKVHIESVQDEITDIQTNIVDLEDTKMDEIENGGILNSFLPSMRNSVQNTTELSQYLLEQLFQLAVNRGVFARGLETRESALQAQLEMKNREKEQALYMLRIALQHSTVPFDVDGLFMEDDEDDDNSLYSDSNDENALNNECGDDEGGNNDWIGSYYSSTNKNTSSSALIGCGDDTILPPASPASFLGNTGLEYTEEHNHSPTNNSLYRQNSQISDKKLMKCSLFWPKRKAATPEELLGVTTRPQTSISLPVAKSLTGSSSRPTSFNPAQSANLDHNNNSFTSIAGKLNNNNNNSGVGFIVKNNESFNVLTPTETSKGLVSSITDMKASIGKPTSSSLTYSSTIRSPIKKTTNFKLPNASMTTSLILPKTQSSSISEEASGTPASPGSLRRNMNPRNNGEDNVFKRLATSRPSPNPKKGSINIVTTKKQSSSSGSTRINLTHTADGHSKAILDIHLKHDFMITGSKDRTAKVWDLVKATEICSLQDQAPVAKVRLLTPQTALTVCSYFIKMWDLREPEKKRCVRTLWSSGLSEEGCSNSSSISINQDIMTTSASSMTSSVSSSVVCPPPGENYIADIAISHTTASNSSNHNQVMFLATANSVKLWDMRAHRYCAIGKLHGNHQAPVMVLAAFEGPDSGNCTVVTGSKDHYIKVFEVSSGSAGLILPCQELDPPHYDGVECLEVDPINRMLFSGSRDNCIKKWDLKTGKCLSSLSQAHRDWVQALCLVKTSSANTGCSSTLVSGCRSGVIKLWSPNTCTFLGDYQAHESGITAIRASASHSNRFFSSSNDCTVKFWQVKSTDTQ